MGGSHVVTSKISIIKLSQRDNADVDYAFCQVGIDDNSISYASNCGNISAAVGPFAIDEGLVKEDHPGASADPKIKTREVRIYNTGSKKVLVSHVPVDPASGKALEAGDFAIAGCPGTGAPILMDYRNVRARDFVTTCRYLLIQVVGASLGREALPTGVAVNETTVNGKMLQITIFDVANIIIFARAQDLGIAGNETSATINNNKALMARVKELRGKGAHIVRMCKDWQSVDEESPMLPMVVLVSPATSADAHIQSRLFLDNKCHTSMAGTGAICILRPAARLKARLSEKSHQQKVLGIQVSIFSIRLVSCRLWRRKNRVAVMANR